MNDDLLGLMKAMVIDDPEYRLILFRKSLLLSINIFRRIIVQISG